MMQEYNFIGSGTFSDTASTSIHSTEQGVAEACMPDRHIVQNIINFARCYQTVEAGGLQTKVFLN